MLIEWNLQILAVDGVTLLNMSYDDALKLLQNTGVTVDLVLSQIFQQNASNNGDRDSYKRMEDGRVDSGRQNRDQMERAAGAQLCQNSNQYQIKPKKIGEHAMNRNECMATVKSVPDLPKVGLYDGQFTHSTLHTLPS